jgi:hypothetical protein
MNCNIQFKGMSGLFCPMCLVLTQGLAGSSSISSSLVPFIHAELLNSWGSSRHFVRYTHLCLHGIYIYICVWACEFAEEATQEYKCICSYTCACIKHASEYFLNTYHMDSRLCRRRKNLKGFFSWKQPESWVSSFYEVNWTGFKIIAKLEASHNANNSSRCTLFSLQRLLLSSVLIDIQFSYWLLLTLSLRLMCPEESHCVNKGQVLLFLEMFSVIINFQYVCFWKFSSHLC